MDEDGTVQCVATGGAPDRHGREQGEQSGRGGRIRVHITVGGMVQGVGYRYFTVTAALKFGLTGWVRNLMNGDVELEAQGARSDVAMLISRLKLGPKWSDVERVAVDEMPLQDGEAGFRVRGY